MFPNGSQEPSANFVQLLSKACTGTIKQLLWCPTMDLLMMCTEDDQLALHRLNWQRLWVIQPESSVSSATWSSDGKMLAIGGTDGRIALVDSEQGEVLRLHASLPDAAQPILALHWQDVSAATETTSQRPSTMASRLQTLCSPPPPPTPPPGYQRPSPYAPPTTAKGTQYSHTAYLSYLLQCNAVEQTPLKSDAPSNDAPCSDVFPYTGVAAPRGWAESPVRSTLALLMAHPSSPTPTLRLLTTDGFPLASAPLEGACLPGAHAVQVRRWLRCCAWQLGFGNGT